MVGVRNNWAGSTPGPPAGPARPSGCRRSSRRRSRRSCRGCRRGRDPATRPRSRRASPRRPCAAVRTRAASRPRRPRPAAGSAERSTLPLGDSGNARDRDEPRRDHRLGQPVLEPSPQVRRPRWRPTRPARGRRPAAVSPRASSRATTAACLTAGWRTSTASTSASSTRTPRIFTWPSRGPAARARRRRATAPGRRSRTSARPAAPNGSGTNRSAVRRRVADVAPCHARPADVQLAHHAGRHRLRAGGPARRPATPGSGRPIGAGRILRDRRRRSRRHRSRCCRWSPRSGRRS